MKLKEMSALRMEPVMTAGNRRRQSQDRPSRDRSREDRLHEDRPGLRAALLGLICVIGVFALLGALYSFG